MTFSQSVKNEILKNLRGAKDCCARAFLYGSARCLGSLMFKSGDISFLIESENKNLLCFFAETCLKLYGEQPSVERESKNGLGQTVHSLCYEGELARLLGLSFTESEGFRLMPQSDVLIASKPCCRKAFLQAVLLSCGSVAVPELTEDLEESRSGARYHLELRFTDESFADLTLNLWAKESFVFRKTVRKNYTVLYLKDSEKIADVLVYLTAIAAKLRLENVIIGRSLRNAANRQSNCISANIDKTVAASEKQMTAILKLKQNGKLDTLPSALSEAAEIRLEFPEATLEEIAAKLGISKSGASHRLNKLIEIGTE